MPARRSVEASEAAALRSASAVRQEETAIQREIMSKADVLVGALAIGIGASAVMDLWNLFLKLAFSIPSLNYCLLGRWLCHMPSGTFWHASIARARQMPSECLVGWIAHYTIGAGLALGFLAVVSRDWLARPALPPALLYGFGTAVLPLFIMQPALGLGVAASRTPNAIQARVKSLLTHTVFGFGLYSCATALNYLSRSHG